jgi:hypothetical protein
MRLVVIEEAAACLASPLSQLPPTLEVVLLRTLRFLQRRLRMLSQDSSLRVTGRRPSTLDSRESISLAIENNISTLSSILRLTLLTFNSIVNYAFFCHASHAGWYHMNDSYPPTLRTHRCSQGSVKIVQGQRCLPRPFGAFVPVTFLDECNTQDEGPLREKETESAQVELTKQK